MKKPYNYLIILGILLLVSTNAYSQDGSGTMPASFWVQSLMGATLLLIGAYVKGTKDSFGKQIDEIKRDLKAVEKEYQTQSDLKLIVEAAIEPIKVELRHIQEKLK